MLNLLDMVVRILSTLDIITNLLIKKNIKQKELTDYLGISKNTFTDWKSGRIKSYTKYLPQIAEFLECSVDYLLGTTTLSENHHTPEYLDLYNLYSKLDDIDKAEIRGEMKQMLKADKYKTTASQSFYLPAREIAAYGADGTEGEFIIPPPEIT